MSKLAIYTEIVKDNGGNFKKVKKEVQFLGFGMNCVEFPKGVSSRSVALIQLEDGSLKMASLNEIKIKIPTKEKVNPVIAGLKRLFLKIVNYIPFFS